jgi:hypothetical protein
MEIEQFEDLILKKWHWSSTSGYQDMSDLVRAIHELSEIEKKIEGKYQKGKEIVAFTKEHYKNSVET